MKLEIKNIVPPDEHFPFVSVGIKITGIINGPPNLLTHGEDFPDTRITVLVPENNAPLPEIQRLAIQQLKPLLAHLLKEIDYL